MQVGAMLGTACALLWLLVDEIGPAAYALQVMSGLAFMLTFSASSTLVADEAPTAKLGQAIGIFGAANITMNALSPGIAEPLAARFGWSAALSSQHARSCSRSRSRSGSRSVCAPHRSRPAQAIWPRNRSRGAALAVPDRDVDLRRRVRARCSRSISRS